MSQTRLFPESYEPWLAARLPARVTERLATCESCAMVKPTGLTRDPGPFLPDLKCCTYFPFIPNFSLGLLLRAQPEVARVRLAIARKQGLLLPFGLFASPEREELVAKLGDKNFGRKKELLCPFYDTAASGCSIWAHRPGTCTTYFCKSERGANGLALWADVETYLNDFEWALANETLNRLGFGEEISEYSEAVFLEEPGPERDHIAQSIWGEWREREEDLFIACGETALQISAVELDGILGSDAALLEKNVRDWS